MTKPIRVIPVFIAALLAISGCSGGGGGSSTTPTGGGGTVQNVSGTIMIGAPSQAGPESAGRKPQYVSAATTHAYIFINGSATPNNTSSTCTGTGTSGTGTFCTIAWSTSVAVPGSYNFQVETDNGTNVLAEGSASEALVAGTNTLGALTLNGVVANAAFTTTSCTPGTAGTTAGTCSGNVTLSDSALDAIAYTGATTVPTTGNSPTTGTVFDNGAVTFASSTASGLVTGTAQTSGSNVFSTLAANTLTVSGVDTTGVYTFKVQCATATTTGTFGITVGGGASRTSGVNITNAQLSAESPVPTYAASVATVVTAPTYVCVNGVISSATGTLPIN